jgi:AraC-like DNA-binding protein
VERHRATRTLLDQLRDIVAVPRAHFDERQDEVFGAAFLELARAAKNSHIWESYTSNRFVDASRTEGKLIPRIGMVLLDHGGRHADEITLIARPNDLDDVVEHLWIRNDRHPEPGWRVVADASPYLLATVAACGDTRVLRIAVVGARAHAATIDVANRVLTVGVRLRPGALPILTGCSAREFRDRSVLAESVFTRDVLADLELSHDAPVATITRDLVRLVRRAVRRRAAGTTLPVSALRLESVGSLATWLGTPTRTLRERTHREIGLSPKRILRVVRLHTALHAARRAGASWSDIASRAGYADQSHLTREMHDLLGETPSSWRARGTAVSFKTQQHD